MRTFASTLSLGRGGKSDTTSTASAPSALANVPRLPKSRSTSLFAKAPKTHVETNSSALRSRPVLTPGSSCSSDGSASLRTPEDEGLMPPFPKSDEKKRWSGWFGWRKPSDMQCVANDPADTGTNCTPPQPESSSIVQDGQHKSLPRIPRHSVSDSDSDVDDLPSDSSDTPEAEGSTAISPRSLPPRATVIQARANLRTLLRNSLSRPPYPPPLVETPSALFPQSTAALGTSQQTLSLESTIHVRRMLWRLDHRTLSQTEVQTIVSLARRPQPKDASRNRAERKTDDEMISYASMRVGQFSRGLRKWVLRPCFEQRFFVWTPDEKGNVGCKVVMGVDRQLAVCDLEFSKGTEALAGLELDDQTFEQNLFPPLPIPKGPVQNGTPRKRSPPRTTPRKSTFHSSPSPLRLDHAAPAIPVLSPVSSGASTAPTAAPILDVRLPVSSERASVSSEGASVPSKGPSEFAATSGSRSIRFVQDDDADDGVPLGYALQVKKRREEKARFLQAEREKREREVQALQAEERQKRAAEQRRATEEQGTKEEERRRVEEEKRAREERTKAKYNEEIAAARQRSENARLGMENYTNIREMNQRENGRTYSRPAYDPIAPPVHMPRRQTLDIAAPTDNLSRNWNTSRPTSIAESAEDKRRSVVPSAYKLSHLATEDVRSSTHRRQLTGTDVSQQQQQASRPTSVTSSSSRPASIIRTQSVPSQMPLLAYPMMPVMPLVPPVPVMPIWNMPLLPPNAPFMMQQYSRSPSPGSNPHSRNPSPSPSASRRQSVAQQPPSSSRRQSSVQPSTSPSRRNLHPSGSSSRSQPAAAESSRSRHSRYQSGDKCVPQTSDPSRGSDNASRRPSESTSYSTLQQSVSQPIYHDNRFQKSRHGSSTNLVHLDAKRQTSIK